MRFASGSLTLKKTEITEKLHLQQQGLKWVMEMELVDDPQLINNIKANILGYFPQVLEVEILSLHRHGTKDMLIWVELSWMGRIFYKKRILEETLDLMNRMLPSFRFRIVSDYHIMELAIERIKEHFANGKGREK